MNLRLTCIYSRGLTMKIMTLLLPHLWVNGNLPGALLILDSTKMSLIRWIILMSSGGHTRNDDTLRPFRRYVMADKDSRVRHLPEQVLRQYGYVQTIPWLHSWCPSSSCPSLRGGYCWAAVDQTSSRTIPDHQQHQSQSEQCNGASCCVW